MYSAQGFIISNKIKQENFLNPAQGSFTASCQYCTGDVNDEKTGGFLSCACRKIDGTYLNSTLNNLNTCVRINNIPQVWNNNGVLSCDRINSFNPASGSYINSCTNCNGDVNSGNGNLNCRCKNKRNISVNSSINILKFCPIDNRNSPQVRNDNGVLRCN